MKLLKYREIECFVDVSQRERSCSDRQIRICIIVNIISRSIAISSSISSIISIGDIEKCALLRLAPSCLSPFSSVAWQMYSTWIVLRGHTMQPFRRCLVVPTHDVYNIQGRLTRGQSLSSKCMIHIDTAWSCNCMIRVARRLTRQLWWFRKNSHITWRGSSPQSRPTTRYRILLHMDGWSRHSKTLPISQPRSGLVFT